MRKLPDGRETKDDDEYANAWLALGRKLEKVFDGYEAQGFQPGIVMVKYEKNRFDETVVADRFTLSVDAALLLVKKYGAKNEKDNEIPSRRVKKA